MTTADRRAAVLELHHRGIPAAVITERSGIPLTAVLRITRDEP